MSEFWLEILRRQAEAKGRAAVARELGISASAVSLVLNEKYQADTANIEARVINLYGNGGKVACPVIGDIDPALCVRFWEKAQKIGVRCGNPATIRLYKACLKCDLRA